MRTYSIRALSREIDELMRKRYPTIEVEAEVAQVSVPGSGHAYLQLRDADDDRYRRGTPALKGVCWRDSWRRLAYRPAEGDKVVVRGRLGIYADRSQYQIYIHLIRPAGAGDLAKQIAARIERLRADGLLDPARKRPLPAYPSVVGVATSRTGAALQDFLKVSRERWPAARILVAPCTVQGERAAASVLRAVDLLLEDGRSEVIVVTRGGGSKEDLMPFQDERLARFLAESPVPVVSAVGHEVDTTIADMVADAVAPTPSAAAMQVFPDGEALRQRIDTAELALGRAMRRTLTRYRERVAGLRSRLRHPRQRLREVRRRAQDLEDRLHAVLARRLEHDEGEVARLGDRLRAGARSVLADRRRRLEVLAGRLEALSPLAVLGRGYAIVTGEQGVVRAADQVAAGDELEVRVAEGAFGVRVTPSSQPS